MKGDTYLQTNKIVVYIRLLVATLTNARLIGFSA